MTPALTAVGSFAHTTLRLAPLILEYTDLKSLLTLETTAVFRKEPFPFVQLAPALDGFGHVWSLDMFGPVQEFPGFNSHHKHRHPEYP